MTERRTTNVAVLFPGESMNSGFGEHVADIEDARDQRWAEVARRVEREPHFRNMLSERAERLNEVLRTAPGKVDLRAFCSPVRDQGSLNACVGFSLAALVEFLLRTLAAPDITACSPHFLWYFARQYEFSSASNVGAQLRDGMRVLTHVGCSPETLDPYDPIAFIPPPKAGQEYQVMALLTAAAAREPSREAIGAAGSYVLDAYYRLSSLADYKDCLSRGFGFVMSCPLYRSAAAQALKDGVLAMPGHDEQPVASHSLFVCGYEAEKDAPGGGYLICKSSQGRRRGDGGYFRVPFAYATIGKNGGSTLDAWTALGFVD